MEWSFSYTFYIDKLPCMELPSSKAGFPWQAHMSSVLPVSQFSEMYRCFILLMEKNKTPPQKKRKQKPPNFLLHLKLSWNHFRFSAVPVNYLLSSWQVLGCFFFFLPANKLLVCKLILFLHNLHHYFRPEGWGWEEGCVASDPPCHRQKVGVLKAAPWELFVLLSCFHLFWADDWLVLMDAARYHLPLLISHGNSASLCTCI